MSGDDNPIQDELRQVLENWKGPGGIHTVRIGHPVRVRKGKEERHTVRQAEVYEYCFQLIEHALAFDPDAPLEFDGFCLLAGNLAPATLSAEEREAAESLAWKALVCGWQRALANFPDEGAINITRKGHA
ncbi:MAG TPA: hypothetical protein VJX23_02985 [Candidatus Binataceae bacterium]|nr:hypothetical protein [Candidatus Binataceae bacterium]